MRPPSLPTGVTRFFDREVWDDTAAAEYATWEMQGEDEWIYEDE